MKRGGNVYVRGKGTLFLLVHFQYIYITHTHISYEHHCFIENLENPIYSTSRTLQNVFSYKTFSFLNTHVPLIEQKCF